MTDFVALAVQARRQPTKANLDALWAAMFQQPHWYFIPIPSVGGQFAPYVGVVGQQRWVMTFTDPWLAAQYASAAKIAMPGLEPLLSLAPRAAAVHLPAMRALGVVGVLVNPGPEAFYTPFENLRQMLDYFQRPPAPLPVRPPDPPPPTMNPPPPLAYAQTVPVAPPTPLPTQRVSRDELVALVQAAADDPARLPWAIAALKLEPEWLVIATKANPALPALEIWADGRMAAQVYTDRRSAETMQQLMAMVPGDHAPLLAMTPEAAMARFGHEDMVELVVFNPRAEQLMVPLARLL